MNGNWTLSVDPDISTCLQTHTHTRTQIAASIGGTRDPER